MILSIVAALILGYLLGSIPFGLVLTRLAGTTDIRTIGSGSIGATNVLRTGNKALAAGTLLGDALKGTVAVIVAGLYFGGPNAAMAAGFGAFIGHLYPVWLKFNGGKGVATYIGILLGLYWPAAVALCAIWLAVALIFRYSSLAALISTALIPAFLLWQHHTALAILFSALTLLLWFAHRANISRLMSGTESKIGAKG